MHVETTSRRNRWFDGARVRVLAAACLLLWASVAFADGSLVEPAQMPGPLQQVHIEQQLGADLPLDTRFVDQDGRDVALGDYFGDRPVILAFVYYECPMLCSLILNGMASSLDIVKLNPGEDFEIVAISIDPGETPAMALESRRLTLARYGEDDPSGWNFLVGDEETVSRVAAVAGFGYEYLPETDEYAHASGIMVATPEGRLSQYFYGVEYPPKDVRLALVEASSNRIGNVVDQILLYCYRYDPEIGQYTAVTMRILRLAAVVFIVALALFLWFNLRRDARLAREAQNPTLGAV